jgi:hypothetical protein
VETDINNCIYNASQYIKQILSFKF